MLSIINPTYAVRNQLNQFFCIHGWGKQSDWQIKNKIDTYTPLAKFIYTRGVDEWEIIANSRNILILKFDCMTVLNMTLSGCTYSSSVNNQIKAAGGANVETAYFDEDFYMELCEVASDYERAEMKLSIKPYFYKNVLPTFSKIDENSGLVVALEGRDHKGEEIWNPVNPVL